MEYFKLDQIFNYSNEIRKQYDKNSEGAQCYKDTRDKLKYLGNRLESELNVQLTNNYNEQPNKMAGQGRGFVLKEYILTGFIPSKFIKEGKNIFIKLCFYNFNNDIKFIIDIDVNFSDKTNPYNLSRTKIQNETVWEIPVDESFPKNWDDLINVAKPVFNEKINYIETFLNEYSEITQTNSSKRETNQMNPPLNQILYGPPGTGKTYNTINKAIEIINPKFYLQNIDNREEIKAEFKRLVKEERIVFTTFHQSMSYEDFVEGIKPQEPKEEGGNIIYKVDDGIFKMICDGAKSASVIKDIEKPNETNAFPIYTVLIKDTGYPVSYFRKTDKNNLWSYLQINPNESNEFDENGNILKTTDLISGKIFFEGEEKGDYRITCYKSNNETRLLPSNMDFKKILYENRDRTAIKFREDNKDIDVIVASDEANKKEEFSYVLIIDEINRGNVSSIFGELVTLIEEDKRLGKNEALEVVLPYSKNPFSVPSNLYIIGTMNTADRSVEALDTALRRRFSFVEMPPEYDVIKTDGKLKEKKGILNTTKEPIDLVILLETINKRIKILLDRDHLIGHSYFMNVDSEESLKQAFSKQIIPLLQEYFYGDYGKIQLVLGKDFCDKKGENSTNIKFASSDYDTSGFDEKVIYEIKNINDENFNIVNAIKTLLNESANIQEETAETAQK